MMSYNLHVNNLWFDLNCLHFGLFFRIPLIILAEMFNLRMNFISYSVNILGFESPLSPQHDLQLISCTKSSFFHN